MKRLIDLRHLSPFVTFLPFISDIMTEQMCAGIEIFGIDSETQEATTPDDRLKRPWTVFLFGVLLSVAEVVIGYARSTSDKAIDDKVLVGMAAFACLAILLSAAYALIGAKYSRRLARQVVGWIGGTLAMAGVAWFIYALLVLAP